MPKEMAPAPKAMAHGSGGLTSLVARGTRDPASVFTLLVMPQAWGLLEACRQG